MMMNELVNMTNAAGGGHAGRVDLRQRVRRLAAGGGRAGGIGPLAVGPPFVLATAGGVPQHRCGAAGHAAVEAGAERGHAGVLVTGPLLCCRLGGLTPAQSRPFNAANKFSLFEQPPNAGGTIRAALQAC